MGQWTPKKIAFISVLIATSIAFVVIGAQMAAISSLPSIKLSLAGLPVKISGYLFGPIIGFVIGFTTDILTFLFVPTFYHPLYSLALAISGILPGIFALIFHKFINKKFVKDEKIRRIKIKNVFLRHKIVISESLKKIEKLESKINKNKTLIQKIEKQKKDPILLNVNLFFAFLFISFVYVGSLIFIWFIPKTLLEQAFEKREYLSFLANKTMFMLVMTIGFALIYIYLIVTRFKMKQDSFIKMVPIMTFIVFTEFINLPIVALADQFSLGINFSISLIGSFVLSPVKIWFNLIIISFATKIVSPLILNKEKNSF